MAEWLVAIATLFAGIAAGLSAYAAFTVPKEAAKIAEQLRADRAGEESEKFTKEQIFSILMQNRATIFLLQPNIALNSIDYIFADDKAVKDAWSEYHKFLTSGGILADMEQQKLLKKLLVEMSKVIGLGEKLSNDDFDRVYVSGFVHSQIERHLANSLPNRPLPPNS